MLLLCEWALRGRERLNYCKVWLPVYAVKMYGVARLGPGSVRCPEFRGGRFSEVANVLHKRDFKSVTGALSALGSVSASRSVRSGRFYCILKRKRDKTGMGPVT